MEMCTTVVTLSNGIHGKQVSTLGTLHLPPPTDITDSRMVEISHSQYRYSL